MPAAVGRIPFNLGDGIVTPDFLTWGATAQLQGNPTPPNFLAPSQQLVKAHWPYPLTWTLASVVDFTQPGGVFADPITIRFEWTIGVGRASHTIFRTLTGTGPLYVQQSDVIDYPAEDIQGRVSMILEPDSSPPAQFRVTASMFVAPRVYT